MVLWAGSGIDVRTHTPPPQLREGISECWKHGINEGLKGSSPMMVLRIEMVTGKEKAFLFLDGVIFSSGPTHTDCQQLSRL